MQVNFLPCEVLIWPLVVHLEPALIAEEAKPLVTATPKPSPKWPGIVREDPAIARAITSARDFSLMRKIVLSA